MTGSGTTAVLAGEPDITVPARAAAAISAGKQHAQQKEETPT